MIQWLLGVVYFLSSKAKHDEYKKLKETNIKIGNYLRKGIKLFL